MEEFGIGGSNEIVTIGGAPQQ